MSDGKSGSLRLSNLRGTHTPLGRDESGCPVPPAVHGATPYPFPPTIPLFPKGTPTRLPSRFPRIPVPAGYSLYRQELTVSCVKRRRRPRVLRPQRQHRIRAALDRVVGSRFGSPSRFLPPRFLFPLLRHQS